MGKKEFDTAAATAKFFTQGTQQTQDTQDTHKKQGRPIKKDKKATYRYNLCLDMELKPFLMKRAWEQRQAVSQYLNELIRKEMEAYLEGGGTIEDEWKE